MTCELGHSWEVESGDYVICYECDQRGKVIVLGELQAEYESECLHVAPCECY